MSINAEKVKRYVYIAILAVLMAGITVCEIWRKQIFGEGAQGEELYSMTTRLLGGVLCLLLVFYCEYTEILKIRLGELSKAILFTLPCWVIALNNFPIIPYITGEAYIDGRLSMILFYAFQCLCVGFFEEMAFRGCIFMMVLQKKRRTVADLFWCIVISSAIFGAVHFVNIFMGASPISVILQIGYSFLIGGMCSVVLMKTGCLWHCVLIHAVYNFCGGVVPRLGGGVIWTVPEIALTAIVAVIVTVYIIVSLIRIDPGKLGYMFNEKRFAGSGEENVNL